MTMLVMLIFPALIGCKITGNSEKNLTMPNIVFILADDLGFSDISCYGSEIYTPNIDMLAENGIRFSQCYNSSTCVPSRRNLLTGYYFNQVEKLVKKDGGLKPQWVRILPHYLAELGYRSYHSGKWHLSNLKAIADAGFDHSYLLYDTDRYFSPQRHSLDDIPLPPISVDEGYYATQAITDYAINFVDGHSNSHSDSSKPFFLYLAYTAPHFPLQGLSEDIKLFKNTYKEGWDSIRNKRWQKLKDIGIVNCKLSERNSEVPPPVVLDGTHGGIKSPLSILGSGETPMAPDWAELTNNQKEFQAIKMSIHAAMVKRMDLEIGRIISQLRSKNLIDNTIIFFASDNGACATLMIRGDGHNPKTEPGSASTYLSLGPAWANTSNSPLKYTKVWCHEGGISSPLIVHWPAGIKNIGGIRHTPVHFIDIVPTLIKLAGGNITKSKSTPTFPGRNILPCFEEDTNLGREYLFFDNQEFGSFKAIRKDDFKLVSSPYSQWALYDLSIDRAEMDDLSNTFPQKVYELSKLWEECNNQFQQDAMLE